MSLLEEIRGFETEKIQEIISDYSSFSKFGVFLKKGFIDKDTVDRVSDIANSLVTGEYPTGLRPDIVKKPTHLDLSKVSSDTNQVHSICNGWKSNSMLKKFILDSGFGTHTKNLTLWKSVKLNQDSIYFVQPQCGSTSFHADNPYQCWHTSNGGIVTAWLALSEINNDSGGIEYLLGSNRENKAESKMIKGNFISDGKNPYDEAKVKFGDDWNTKFFLFRPILQPGDLLIHHGDIWHGSSLNNSNRARISLSLHLMDGESRFSELDVSPVYGKYKLENSDEMNTTFFPDLWS